MSNDRQKYDTDDFFLSRAAVLTEDPKVFPSKDPEKPPLVIVKFTSESRKDNTLTQWVEAKVRSFDANRAAFLKKGDQLPIEGKPIWEKWERNGKSGVTMKLDDARLTFGFELKAKTKERGFTPGAKGGPAPQGNTGKAPAREVKDINFGDED